MKNAKPTLAARNPQVRIALDYLSTSGAHRSGSDLDNEVLCNKSPAANERFPILSAWFEMDEPSTVIDESVTKRRDKDGGPILN